MESSDVTFYLDTLENGQLHFFSDWSSEAVPKICAGVYTIWRNKELIYVGMSGRSLNAEIIEQHRTANLRARGMFTRLKSHASGRRSGDQFCIYVGDRLVLPTLKSNDVSEIVNGKLSFDKLIRNYIHKNLSFRFVETENDRLAFQIENAIKAGDLNAGKPFLNPSKSYPSFKAKS